jgi:hypothetical protein
MSLVIMSCFREFDQAVRWHSVLPQYGNSMRETGGTLPNQMNSLFKRVDLFK